MWRDPKASVDSLVHSPYGSQASFHRRNDSNSDASLHSVRRGDLKIYIYTVKYCIRGAPGCKCKGLLYLTLPKQIRSKFYNGSLHDRSRHYPVSLAISMLETPFLRRRDKSYYRLTTGRKSSQQAKTYPIFLQLFLKGARIGTLINSDRDECLTFLGEVFLESA